MKKHSVNVRKFKKNTNEIRPLFCSQLRSGGSQILEGCVAEIPNISSLDISDNGEEHF